MTKYTPEERINEFWSNVDKNGSIPVHMPHLGKCWEWIRSLDSHGYGTKWWNNKIDRAHRVSWMIANGEIPDGLWVLHKCDNPICCNPDHLFLGNSQDNIDDKIKKGRAFTGDLRGEKHFHKVTATQVMEIRRRYAEGGITQKELGSEYGITQSAVSTITVNKNWKSV